MSGRFEIERELGRGGMGVVYLARDRERDGELVALKRLSVAAQPDSLRREFEAARRLRHPVIVRVHDLGRDDDGPFLTMAYVDGEDLGALAGKVSPERVVRWTTRIADALEYARRRGFVHGDIKPQNIRVSRHDPDDVRLLDLGLARAVGSAAAGGTPAYIAPEVLAGQSPDARSDLWSLGCVLYQLLTGEPPFSGTARDSPPPPVADDVPENLRHVIARLLARRPEDRPGRPSDLPLLLDDVDGAPLPLPDGDLVGREAVLAALRPGRVVLLEAAPGMGASRVLRTICEDADEREAAPPMVFDHEAGRTVDALKLARCAADGAVVVVVVRPAEDVVVGGAETVRLQPLDEGELRQLVASRLPLEPHSVAGVASWLLRESGGVPALAVDALEGLRREGLLRAGPTGLLCDLDALVDFEPPANAGSAVARVLAELSDGATRVGARLSIASDADRHPELEALALLDSTADGVRFRAAAIARALVSTLDADVARALHSAEATRLMVNEGAESETVARHLLAAGRGAEAGSWLVKAAERRREGGDRRHARRFLERAVVYLEPGVDRGRAHLDLARELVVAGQVQRAHDEFAAARTEDGALASATWAGQARLFADRQQHVEAASAAVELLRLGERDGRESDRAQAHGILGRTEAQQRRYDTARAHLSAALELYRRLGEQVDVARIGNALGNVAYLEKRLDEAIDAYRLALDAARSSGDRRVRGSILLNLSNIYAGHRRGSSDALSTLEEAIQIAEEDGNKATLARTLTVRAFIEVDSGRADEAARSLERALEIRDEIEDHDGVIQIRLLQGLMAITRGDFARAEASLRVVLDHGDVHDDPNWQVPALDELGYLALERTRWREAESYLSRGLEIARDSEQRGAEVSIIASLARARIELRDFVGAERLLSELPVTEGLEPEAGARLARSRAQLSAGEGRLDEARGIIEESIAELRATGFQIELARDLLLLAPILANLGLRSAALEVVAEARDVFERHGAKPGLARALLLKARIKAGVG